MYGAITGDIISQSYECYNNKIKSLPLFSEAPLFTDDSVMIIAICGGILNTEINFLKKRNKYWKKIKEDFAEAIKWEAKLTLKSNLNTFSV